MSWIRDWTSVGSQTELTLSIFRVFKTSWVCHSNGTTYNCIALIPWYNKSVPIIYRHSLEEDA
jgi:hypothetical protein